MQTAADNYRNVNAECCWEGDLGAEVEPDATEGSQISLLVVGEKPILLCKCKTRLRMFSAVG